MKNLGLASHWAALREVRQAAAIPRLCPPKAEATGSNPVGRANDFNGLA